MASVIGIRDSIITDEDGVVLSEENEISSFTTKASGSYFKLFTEDIARLHGTTHAGKKVLFELLSHSMNRRGEIALGLYQKKEMAKRTGFSHTKSIDNGIRSLIRENVLVRVARGTYKLNPNIFAKGNPKEIEESRMEYAKLTIIYNDKGRKVLAEVKEKQST